jgi:hypothetical protein
VVLHGYAAALGWVSQDPPVWLLDDSALCCFLPPPSSCNPWTDT